MGRVLSQSVFVGGVVYPAGTAETDELSKLIRNPDHWDGDEVEGSDEPAPQKRRARKSQD